MNKFRAYILLALLFLFANSAYAQRVSLSGIYGVASGGTGAATFAANGVLYGNTTGALLVTAQGPANSILTANAGAPSFSASPTIGTSVTTPLVIGGTGPTSPLTLRSTSGVGAAGADIIFQAGNNGSVEAMRILNSGNVGIGTTVPTDFGGVTGVAGTNLQVYSTVGQSRLILNAASIAELHLISRSNAVNDRNYRFRTDANGLVLDQPADGYGSAQGVMYWENNGDVGIGTTTPQTKTHSAETGTAAVRGILSAQYNSDVQATQFLGRKARGTEAAPTVVLTGDGLLSLIAEGYDGASYLQMGSIEMLSTGTIASTRVPTRMLLRTATDAAPSVLTTLLELSAGNAIGVYGVTPVVRGAAVADASGGATVDAEARTAINALLARIRSFGIINP